MGPDSGRVARLRKQVADLERQLAEAAGDRRRREAEALAHSARFLTETLDVETVGRRIVQSVCGLFEVSAAGLRLREPDGSLVLVAASDGDGPYMPIGHVAPPGFGFYGRIVDSGRPLRLPDMLAAPATVLDADVLRRLRGSRQRSLLAVPLRVQERITGVLSIAAATGRVFSDDEVRLLQAFADQAALALENSRSHAEVLQRRREAEELARVSGLVSETLDLASVGERIADAVLRLLDVNSSAIRLLQPDGSLVAMALGGRAQEYAGARGVVPLGVGLIGRAAAEGRPMWTADFRSDDRLETSRELRERNVAAGIIAGLAVPMRVAATVTGVLSVGSSTRRVFSEREIGLLQSFADQAAIAIANAQAQEALARQAERLRILHEIDRALIAEQAPAAIAEAVVRPLRELLDVPRVIVNLFDLETGQVEWLAAAGRHRVRLGPGVRYSIELAGDLEALRRGEPQIIDIRALPPSPEAEAMLAAGLNVYMVVPMSAGGELVGSISVCDAAGPFPPERVSIAQEVATQLAIAIAQARLHERVRRQAAELEQRVEERTRELSAATAEADHANRAKSEFLSRMSHELRTPLNAILGFAQLLEMGTLSTRQSESVEHILRAGRHLLGLINEVLDISRIEAGRLQLSLEPVPVRETLAQAVQLVQPAATALAVSVRADAIDEGLHVLADRQRLQQVFLNLLSNAIKYNRPRGTVRVTCAPKGDDRLRISVTDTGEGIAADKLPRLFTPFDRLGAEAGGVEGTGLGLALSKSLVEAMGGTLQVESEPGAGSTFSAELVVVPGPAAVSDVTSLDADRRTDGTPPAARRTILYIEDNLSNLRLVETILSRRPGLTVLSAMQGRVGVDLARSHRPDLILLDRHLPDIAGEEVVRLLQADAGTRQIPVVILSADAIPGGIRRFLDSGVRAYLTKPLDVRHLLAVIDEALQTSED
jgi:signal transduction histidine kinase/putative methionine-R-sulfoxide reductase with GAF domain/ActR/RegA family two-component response regulator